MQHELMLAQRLAEALLELELLDIDAVERRVEEAVLAAPGALGRVHGAVRVADQGVDFLGVARGDGDADARAGVQLGAVQLVARGQVLGQARRPGVDLLFAAVAGQQHHEFVAAEARRLVAGLQQGLDAPGHRLQQQVADAVAEAVVDRLEAVQVDEQHRRQAPPAALLGQGAGGHLDELPAVVQAAEVVGGGGLAAARVLGFQATDQLAVLLLGVAQGEQRLLLAAQHVDHREEAEHHHAAHDQVEQQVAGLAVVDGGGDVPVLLADHQAHAQLRQMAEQALVGEPVGHRGVAPGAQLRARRVAGGERRATVDDTVAVGAQPLAAAGIQQLHEAAGAEIDVLVEPRQVADVQVDAHDARDRLARLVRQRHQQRQAPGWRLRGRAGRRVARRRVACRRIAGRRVACRKIRHETEVLGVGVQGVQGLGGQRVVQRCMAGEQRAALGIVEAHTTEQRVAGQPAGQLPGTIRFVQPGDRLPDHRLGAVGDLPEVLRQDGGQVEVFGGIGGQHVVTGTVVLVMMQGPDEHEDQCAQHQGAPRHQPRHDG